MLPKTETFAVWGLQYVFTAKAGADFGVLADGTGVSGVLGTNVWFMVLGRLRGNITKTQNPCCVGIAICFYRQGWADFMFFSRWHRY
jgi:hypothetical protein